MTSPRIEPYLFFGGRCEEALAFYVGALGATVEILMRYSESPEPPPPGMLAEGYADKIMHATLRVGEAVLMASDGCGEAADFRGFRISLALPDADQAREAFTALADGGEVQMPLVPTFWAAQFGMLTDRFGIGWMITVDR